MRQVVITQFGDPDVLQLVEAPTPEPSEGEVMISVQSAGVNPIDYKTRAGQGFVAGAICDSLPWVPGFDVAGTIETLGPGVHNWRIGDPVVGMVGFPRTGGGYAEKAVVSGKDLCRAPDSLPLEEAGGVPLAALTAWQGLFIHLALQPDQKVLILGGAGGVGHFAIQFAAQHGAHVVATGSGANEDFLHKIGAHEVINYEAEDVHDVCYGLDAVLDLVGGEVGKAALSTLSDHGKLVTVPTVTAEMIRQAGEQRGFQVSGYVVEPDTDQLEEILALLGRDEVRLHVSAAYPLADAPAAQRRQEEGHVRGKLILQPCPGQT